MLKIQNLVVFKSKNIIQISRGMRQVFISFLQGGNVVVKLDGYDRYYFCPDTLRLFARRSAFKFVPMRPEMDGSKVFYRLSKNGVQSRVYVWQILRNNMKGIETFIRDRNDYSA